MAKSIDVSGLDIFYGDFKAVEDVSMTIEPRSVTAFIGRPAAASRPSCAPSTACTR